MLAPMPSGTSYSLSSIWHTQNSLPPQITTAKPTSSQLESGSQAMAESQTHVTTNHLASPSVPRSLTPTTHPPSRSPSISPWGPSVWGGSPLLPFPPPFTSSPSPSIRRTTPTLHYEPHNPPLILPIPMTRVRSPPTIQTSSTPPLVTEHVNPEPAPES